jgi:hypothetical protein
MVCDGVMVIAWLMGELLQQTSLSLLLILEMKSERLDET